MKEDVILSRIKELCAEKGWSVYRLAKEADVAYSTLDNLFHRNNAPTIPTLSKLCDGLDISLSAFFADTSNPSDLTDKQKDLIRRYNELPRRDKELLDSFLSVLENNRG